MSPCAARISIDVRAWRRFELVEKWFIAAHSRWSTGTCDRAEREVVQKTKAEYTLLNQPIIVNLYVMGLYMRGINTKLTYAFAAHNMACRTSVGV